MSQPEKLDDRFTEGIWYDAASGGFCKIQRGDNSVDLVNPASHEVYHKIQYDEWTGEDFYKVPDEAVEDPAEYMTNIIEEKLSQQTFDPGYLFADVNTEVKEKDVTIWTAY